MPIPGIVASGISGHLTAPSSFESIATATGTGSSNVITFSSIPSTYKSLQIRAITKNTASVAGLSGDYIRINGDTGTNYANHLLNGNGTTVTASGYASQNRIYQINTDYSPGGEANIMGTTIIDIIDYASSTKYKTIRAISGCDSNGATSQAAILLFSGLWQSTSAITSISFTTGASGSYATTTSFALYGIK